jgi:hypothetical protein
MPELTENPVPPLRTIDVRGTSFDLGSDWHYDLETPTDQIVEHIRRAQQSSTLLCLGDVFLTENGEDATGQINALLEGLSPHFEEIFFSPGNHDLRGRPDPWHTLRYPGNVVHSPRNLPIIGCTRTGLRILLANLFYDLKFIDPSIVGLTREDIIKYYKENPDGTTLLGGELGSFPDLTHLAAQALTPDIDVVATHVLPHPSLVKFLVPKRTEEHERLERKTGIPFICDPAEDERKAAFWTKKLGKKVTPEGWRTWWNQKSIVMGSNLLEHPLANPQEGIVAAYGHNHRSNDRTTTINGKRVHFVAHQPYYGKK